MAQFNRIAALSGMAAALSMAATPAAAAEIPASAPLAKSAIAAPAVFDEDTLKAERDRRWRYRGHRHRHRHHVSTGDVLAGVLIIGGIAAIANAASNSERERRYRYRDERYRDYRNDRVQYRERRDTRRSGSGRGIDGAVDMCLSEIERDVRVDSVDSVDRTGEGWRVRGSIFNGDPFTCVIGEDGRIESVDYGNGFAAIEPSSGIAPSAGNQHSDDRYRAAWAQVDRDPPVSPAASEDSSEQLPAYPGGPIDGDLAAEDVEDGYSAAEVPTA